MDFKTYDLEPLVADSLLAVDLLTDYFQVDEDDLQYLELFWIYLYHVGTDGVPYAYAYDEIKGAIPILAYFRDDARAGIHVDGHTLWTDALSPDIAAQKYITNNI